MTLKTLVAVVVGTLCLAIPGNAFANGPKYDLGAANACFGIQLLGRSLNLGDDLQTGNNPGTYSDAVDQLKSSKTKGAKALAKRMDGASNEVAQERAVHAGITFCNKLGIRQ